jgi:predicted nucleic acid-binding protein
MELVATIDLLDRAFSLSLDLDHPIYDCLYLALALDTDARLVTADRRFTRVVRGRHRLADHIVVLGELAH